MKHNKDDVLFRYEDDEVTYGDFVRVLKEAQADQCDVLFVHSEISFGLLEKGIGRKQLKEILLDILLELHVKTLIFPTFTFSFCNKESYDSEHTATKMGMLPEYVRKREDAIRTDDPILSVAIIGDADGFEKMTAESSCGTGGIFHQLHTSGKKVKFLFFGTSVMQCFTYLHYVEEVKKVPYRYLRKFSGEVVEQGVKKEKTILLNVRYKDVIATLPSTFARDLVDAGIMITKPIGQSSISVVDESKSFDYICNMLEKDPYICAILPEDNELLEEYEFGNVTTM